MWNDPLTNTQYTDVQREEMVGLPAYKKLVARLVKVESAPEPEAAATKVVKQKKDGDNVESPTA